MSTILLTIITIILTIVTIVNMPMNLYGLTYQQLNELKYSKDLEYITELGKKLGFNEHNSKEYAESSLTMCITLSIVLALIVFILINLMIAKAFRPKNTKTQSKQLNNPEKYHYYIRPISTEIFNGQFTFNVEFKNKLTATKFYISTEDFFIKKLVGNNINAIAINSKFGLKNKITIKPEKTLILKIMFDTAEDGIYFLYYKGSKIDLGKITKYRNNEIIYDETNNKGEII